MTVSADENYTGPFIGDGVNVVFPFDFYTTKPDHIKICIRSAADGTTQEYANGSIFVAAANTNQDDTPGGEVTTDSPVADGDLVWVRLEVPYEQLTDLENQGGFFPEVVEKALDKLTVLVRQVFSLASRSIRFPKFDGGGGELPAAVDRQNTVLGFDGAGEVELLPTSGLGGAGPGDAGAINYVLPDNLGLDVPGAVARTVEQRLAERVSVLDFGAVRGGSEDNNSAFSLAINNRPYGATLYFPAGEYFLAGSVEETLTSPLRMELAPGARIVGDDSTSFMFRIRGGANRNSFHITGGQIDNSERGFAPALASGTAISLYDIEDWSSIGTVYGNRDRHYDEDKGDSGISTVRCGRGVVTSCYFYGQPDLGIYLSGTAKVANNIDGATQTNPVVISAEGHPFADGDTVFLAGFTGMGELNERYFVVEYLTEDTFALTDEDGSSHAAYVSGGNASEVANDHGDVNIYGNHFINCKTACSAKRMQTRVNFTNNTVLGGDGGFTAFEASTVSPGYGGTISLNTFKFVSKNPIRLHGSLGGYNIVGNLIEDFGYNAQGSPVTAHGIWLRGARDCVITGNTIRMREWVKHGTVNGISCHDYTDPSTGIVSVPGNNLFGINHIKDVDVAIVETDSDPNFYFGDLLTGIDPDTGVSNMNTNSFRFAIDSDEDGASEGLRFFRGSKEIMRLKNNRVYVDKLNFLTETDSQGFADVFRTGATVDLPPVLSGDRVEVSVPADGVTDDWTAMLNYGGFFNIDGMVYTARCGTDQVFITAHNYSPNTQNLPSGQLVIQAFLMS